MLARWLYFAAFLVNIGEPAGPIALADQYDHSWQLSDLHGSVVLLIAGDRDGNKFNNAWGHAARAHCKDQLKIVYIANLTSVPGFMHGFVKGKFVSKDPAHPNGPILLDWKGVVAQRFGFHDNLSNVYVIDRDGVLRYTSSGKGTDTDLEALFHVLDGLVSR